jgi:hypothetical protein
MFEVLEWAGLVSRGKLNERAIRSLPFTRMIDIADTIASSLNSPEAHRVTSPYVHSASLGLGGAPAECLHSRCGNYILDKASRFPHIGRSGDRAP